MYKSFLIICVVSGIRGDTLPDNGFNLQNLPNVDAQSTSERIIPYLASLRMNYYLYFCGGAILNNRWIVTTANCTVGRTKEAMSVVVGTNSLIVGGERYSVEDIIIHEHYNQDLIYNDISLIKVSTIIQFSDRVQPIQLPNANTNAGAELLLTGWDLLSDSGKLSSELQIIDLVVLSLEECRSVYEGTNPVYDTEICTLPKEDVYDDEGPCQADSGSPLVEDGNIVGLVSWGIPCDTQYPDVHTRIISFKDWITEKISVVEK